MNLFQKRAAFRIAAVSLLLAAIASPASWFVARERAEQNVVLLAIEESGRLLNHFKAINLDGDNAASHAALAAMTVSGGMFDIAEIYSRTGQKLAESLTDRGNQVEPLLPKHVQPNYTKASYESLNLSNGQWLLRVFVPLRAVENDTTGPVTGYFEGVRVVPDWQEEQILTSALIVAAMVCLASLLCGAVLYPVVVFLSSDNERKAREVLESHISMVLSLGRAIAKRDSDTGTHNFRVSWIATRIGEEMDLDKTATQALIAGSFLHDVGKIGIPDAILLKPGKLDAAELCIMRRHVELGGEIVDGIGWLEGAKDVVTAHHEKWDGTGYPAGLKGEAIPFAARIFAVADVFDALCSKRPYKEPMGFADVMAILEKDTGSHFDPAVMAAFRPMASFAFKRLENISEDDARELLAERVRRHFDLH